MVEWLYDQGMASATTGAVDRAAENQQWKVVAFLLTNRKDGCTVRAVVAAVMTGGLERVRLFREFLLALHRRQSSGDKQESEAVMEAARARGHADIIEFLREIRVESSSETMDTGADTHSSVVDQVVEAAPLNEARVVDNADTVYVPRSKVAVEKEEQLKQLLLDGELEAYTELRTKFPVEATAAVERVAPEIGKHLQLRTMRYIVEDLGRTDLAETIFEGATHTVYRHTADAAWLRAAYAMTGPSSCSVVAIKVVVASTTACSPRTLQPLYFLLSVCADPSVTAESVAALARAYGLHGIAARLAAWDGNLDPSLTTPIHPLLLHPQTPAWVIEMVLTNPQVYDDPYECFAPPLSWAVHAVYRNDLSLLMALVDLTTSGAVSSNDPMFSFDGARAAAIRENNLSLLQWLLEHVALPVERTLLDDAVYYHQYEIAVWLATHCPQSCRELDWLSRPIYCPLTACGLDDGLLDWVLGCDAVRVVLSFGGLVDYAVRVNEHEALRTLYQHMPEMVRRRPGLIRLARESGQPECLAFLREIGYRISRR